MHRVGRPCHRAVVQPLLCQKTSSRSKLRRLALFSIVSGALWAVALILDPVAFAQFPRAVWIRLFGMLLGVVVFLYARFAPVSPQARTDAGLWLMLINAAAVALIETWALGEGGGPLRIQPAESPAVCCCAGNLETELCDGVVSLRPRGGQ